MIQKMITKTNKNGSRPVHPCTGLLLSLYLMSFSEFQDIPQQLRKKSGAFRRLSQIRPLTAEDKVVPQKCLKDGRGQDKRPAL